MLECGSWVQAFRTGATGSTGQRFSLQKAVNENLKKALVTSAEKTILAASSVWIRAATLKELKRDTLKLFLLQRTMLTRLVLHFRSLS